MGCAAHIYLPKSYAGMTTVPFGSSGLAKRASYTGTAKRDRLEAGYENFKIGVMIHQARLEKGLTQEELAAPMFYRGQNRSLQSCFLQFRDRSRQPPKKIGDFFFAMEATSLISMTTPPDPVRAVARTGVLQSSANCSLLRHSYRALARTTVRSSDADSALSARKTNETSGFPAKENFHRKKIAAIREFK